MKGQDHDPAGISGHTRLAAAPLLVLGLCFSLASATAQSPCDPELEPLADDPLSYRLRGERCEGKYFQKVSTTLTIASLAKFFTGYDLDSTASLTVEWANPFKEEVHLRAVNLRAKEPKQHGFYRMDALVSGAENSFRWPTDVIATLEIVPHQDLGVAGWTRTRIGGTPRDVYLPLRIRPTETGSGAPSVDYRLVLVPGQWLTEVYVSIAPIGEDGTEGPVLYDREEPGPFPPEFGALIPLKGLEDPGVYCVVISATLQSGGSTSLELWLHHTG